MGKIPSKIDVNLANCGRANTAADVLTWGELAHAVSSYHPRLGYRPTSVALLNKRASSLLEKLLQNNIIKTTSKQKRAAQSLGSGLDGHATHTGENNLH